MEWISVKDQPPPAGENVAMLVSDESVAIKNWPTSGYRYTGDEWWCGVPGKYINCRANNWDVTHWTRFPAAPSEEPKP